MNASGLDFAAARARLLALYADGDYASALRLAEAAVIDFDERVPQILFWVLRDMSEPEPSQGATE